MVSSSALFALALIIPAHFSAAAPVDSSLSNVTVPVLEERATEYCKKVSTCRKAIPRNSFMTCKDGKCGFACKSGYTWKDKKCQQASSSGSSSTGVVLAASGYMVDAKLSADGVTGFGAQSLAWNTNAIASWFHTNSGQDSTNGNSWCYNPYDDSMPGFAPDVSVMLNNFGGSNVRAGQAYCGLEAEFVTADGRTATLILMDGFDSAWVRTPSSIDVIYGAFAKLHGSTTNDKNVVEQGVKWRFTGRRDTRYTFNH